MGLGRATAALWIAAFLPLGCASTRIDDDVAAIRELIAVEALPLPDGDVPGEITAEVEQRLSVPLTAPTAVWIALHNSRTLHAKLRRLGIPRGQLLSAQSLPNPTVEVELWQPTATDRSVDVGLAVGWDLSGAILAGVSAHAASAGLDEARLRTASELLQAGYQVRAAFYAARSAAARWTLAARSLDAYAADVDAAQALSVAGNVSDLRLAGTVAAYEAARSEAALAELDAHAARETLNDLLGLHGASTGWTMASAPALPSAVTIPDNLEQVAVRASLDLRAARARSELLARRLGLERTRGWLPTIEVVGLAEQHGEEWEWGGGLRVGLPLFDQNRGETAAVEADFHASLEDLQGAAVSIRALARRLGTRLRVAHARAVHAEMQLVPAKRRVVAEMVLHHNAMQVDVFRLLAAQRDLNLAEMTAAEAVRDFWDARAALDALLAGARVDLVGAGQRFRSTSPETSGDGH